MRLHRKAANDRRPPKRAVKIEVRRSFLLIDWVPTENPHGYIACNVRAE
jgi:hypothetical protein